MTPTTALTILYVNNPQTSARFYRQIFDREPLEASPTFVMFKINDNMLLGLWSQHTMQPATSATAGAMELALPVASDTLVDTTYQNWKNAGIERLQFLQPPTRMEFGYNFVAQDPDGHRLRIFHSADEN